MIDVEDIGETVIERDGVSGPSWNSRAGIIQGYGDLVASLATLWDTPQ